MWTTTKSYRVTSGRLAEGDPVSTTALTFSYGRLSDLRDCYSCDLKSYDRVWSESVWEKCLTDRAARVFVVRVGGEVVGWITGVQRPDYFDVTRCAVLPGLRRSGHCRRLVEGLGRGELRTVLRETNEIGLLTAKGLGFRAVRVLKNRFDTEDGILLVRGRLK